jgi:hypothetical protein
MEITNEIDEKIHEFRVPLTLISILIAPDQVEVPLVE